MPPDTADTADTASRPDFADRLLAWFEVHGRKTLPWQHPRSAYRVWLSEIMLQQTQVNTVIPYFERFLQRFPDVRSLAASPIDDVLSLWAGLGYYARARNLHRCAQQVLAEHGGEFPRDPALLEALPGIGRSTAGAILSQAFGQRAAILDGNVKRLLARHGAVAGWPGTPAVQKQLWALAEARLPHSRMADYTQALMDLGASVCTARQPACARCPVAADCIAHRQARVADYPAAKPKRARPYRRATVLFVRDASGALLFERRPPSGIWGGLWAPPIAQEGEDWHTLLHQRYGLDCVVEGQQPALLHRFTHFDLELQPLRLRLDRASAVHDSSALAWITLGARDALPGMPAPILRLLETDLAARHPFTLI